MALIFNVLYFLKMRPNFDVPYQIKPNSQNIFMAVFIDLWPCLFTTKLSYAQLFKRGHSNDFGRKARLYIQSIPPCTCRLQVYLCKYKHSSCNKVFYLTRFSFETPKFDETIIPTYFKHFSLPQASLSTMSIIDPQLLCQKFCCLQEKT